VRIHRVGYRSKAGRHEGKSGFQRRATIAPCLPYTRKAKTKKPTRLKCCNARTAASMSSSPSWRMSMYLCARSAGNLSACLADQS